MMSTAVKLQSLPRNEKFCFVVGLCFISFTLFSFRDTTANAKSVPSVLGACVKCGDEIELICDGVDEEEALQTIIAAIESGLGE